MRQSLTKLLGLSALLISSLTSPLAIAAYPEKPIKIVVGFVPGGTADGTARMLARELSTRLNQAVVVENKAGANGRIATDYVMRADPDGYTLFYTSIGHAANPSL